jgi:outer membrane protein TolC
LPLPTHVDLASGVAALRREQPGAPPIAVDQPLTLAQVGLLAVENSPELRAKRARRGVAQAQVIEAGLLPDPILSGTYGLLLGGPGVANALTATLTDDLTALITLSARRQAAQQSALKVDADILWQEWQTISRAQTLTIDLVCQRKILENIRTTRDLLQRRARISRRAVQQGNATLQDLGLDELTLTNLRTRYDAATLAQERRWQTLDTLLGLMPDVRPHLAVRLKVPDISQTAAESLVASLPDRRPDLIALRLGYQAQEARLRAAVLGQFPALTVGPTYAEDTSRVQTLGPAVTVGLPLFNRNRGNVAIQQATRAQLRAEYGARLDAAAGGARAIIANLALLKRQLTEARSDVGHAHEARASAFKGLSAGLIDERTFVDLEVTRLEKERQVLNLEHQVLDERIALATLLGAGLPFVHLAAPTGA